MRDLLKNSTHLLLRRQTNILSAAFVIMATYGVSYLLGFFKTWLLISYFFHQAQVLDAFYAALLIPDTVFQLLVVGSLSAAFIPVFTRYLSKKQNEAWRLASSILNLSVVAFFVVSVVIFVVAPQLSSLIGPGFSPGQLVLLVPLLRIMLLAQLFFAVSGFLTGMIQSHQRFLIPALAPIVYNLGIIFGIVVLSPAWGIYGPAWGMVIGSALHMAIQLPLAFSLGFRPSWGVDLRHAGVREIIKLMPPRALALGIDQIEQFVAVILSSFLAAGSLSLFNVARILSGLPATLFGVAIGQAALPALSLQSSSDNLTTFHRTLADSLLQIMFFALPVSTLFIILRIPVVRLAFGAPSLPWLATLLTGKTLAILAISSSAAALSQLVIRGFYALHDTKTPLFVGFVAALFDVAVSVLAVQVFRQGIIGLAIALSATAMLESLVLVFLLSRRLRAYADPGVHVLRSLLKMFITSFIMGVSLWLPMRLLDQFVFDTTRTVPLIALTGITSLIGLSVYLFLSYLFRVEELSSFFSLLRRITRIGRLFKSSSPELVLAPTPET